MIVRKVDSSGRILIPREMREKIKVEAYAVRMNPDGEIRLQPIILDKDEKE